MTDRATIAHMIAATTPAAERAAWFETLPDVSNQFPWAVGNVATRLGLIVHVIDSELMVCSMPVAGNEQHMGILHGGINAVLGETTGSFAAWVGAPEGWTALGLDIAMHHHRGVGEGRIWCVAERVSATRSFATYRIVIYRGDGVCTSSGTHTCALRPLDQTAASAS